MPIQFDIVTFLLLLSVIALIWLSTSLIKAKKNLHTLQMNQSESSGLPQNFQTIQAESHEAEAWLPDAIFVFDQLFNLNWANRTAEEWFGFHLRDYVHSPANQFFQDEQLICFLNERQYIGEYDCPAPMLQETIIRLRLLPYRHGQILLQGRDITQTKKLDQVRRDFVANASHELRTPTSIIYGYLDMMLMDDTKGVNDEWKPAISQMYDQTTRIKQIVDDMMMLSRLEDPDTLNGHHFFEIEPLLESVAKNARIISSDKSHAIKTDISTGYQLLGSRDEIESLATNLVNNAVRYTPDNGKIMISWKTDIAGGILSVSDSGIGIEEKDIPRITERFYRTDTARSRETGGTGLGLAIVNHIANRHQATLKIESTLGKGSTFHVIFPNTNIKHVEAQAQLLLH